MNYYNDFNPLQLFRCRWNTVNSQGAPASMTPGSPTFVMSKDGAAITPTGGVVLTVDLFGVVGSNQLTVDMSADPTTFSSGSDYAVRLGPGSNVLGNNITGKLVGEWSVENRSATMGVITGKVLVVTTNNQFTVQLDTPYFGNLANLVAGDKRITWLTGNNHVSTWLITGATVTDTTHLSLTFSQATSQTVVGGATPDRFVILPS